MSNPERLLDLLAARATEGLPESESSELDAMLAGQEEFQADDFELAAAEIDLAFDSESPREQMPGHLKSRILAAATDHLPAAVPHARRPSAFGWAGWAAAAAILALAFLVPWLGEARKPKQEPPVAALPGQADPRQDLIDSAADLVRVAWAPPQIPEYAQVRGDVIWSNARQAGYMSLEGLPVNAPERAQYQLWIVDPTRDANPIDGGVFDIASDGTTIVPIDAKLLVNDPQAFAITLEQPGGVVVSDGPLLVVAAVSG